MSGTLTAGMLVIRRCCEKLGLMASTVMETNSPAIWQYQAAASEAKVETLNANNYWMSVGCTWKEAASNLCTERRTCGFRPQQSDCSHRDLHAAHAFSNRMASSSRKPLLQQKPYLSKSFADLLRECAHRVFGKLELSADSTSGDFDMFLSNNLLPRSFL